MNQHVLTTWRTYEMADRSLLSLELLRWLYQMILHWLPGLAMAFASSKIADKVWSAWR
jgi:hypothetical protein